MKILGEEINFKPAFGNTNHIEALRIMDRIRHNEQVRDEKKAAALGVEAIEKKLGEDLARVKYLISHE